MGIPGIFYYGSGGEHGKLYLYPSAQYSTNAMSDYQWHHVAVVSNAGSATFYLDGQSNGTASGITGFTVQRMASDTFNEDFSGRLDEVRVYNRALSAQEVKQLYTRVDSRKPAP